MKERDRHSSHLIKPHDRIFSATGRSWIWACCLCWAAAAVVFGESNSVHDPFPSVLNDSQQQWLGRHPKLRIGVTSIPPQIFYNEETGLMQGMCYDFIREVEKKIGYSFVIEHFSTWDELKNAAENREIDVLYAAQKTLDRETKYLFTKPYLIFENMIVTSTDNKKTIGIASLYGKKVAVVKGNSIEEDLKRLYPAIELVQADDELRGLLLVSFKEADAMIIEPQRASYIIADKGITNLRIAGRAEMYFQLSFMVRNDMPELREILDAGLAAIPESRREEIKARWVRFPDDVNIARLLKLLGGVGAVALLAILWNLLLRRQVERRTVELKDELQRRIDAEQYRRQVEEQFRHVIEFCPLAVLLYRLENGGRLVLTAGNGAAERILNIELRPLLGKTLDEIFPNLTRTDIPERLRTICRTGVPWQTHLFEYDDDHIHGKYEIYAFQTSAGQIAVMFSDVTERIAARQAIEQSEALLSSIFRASPVGIGYVVDRIFKHVNDRMCSMTGYSADQLLGRSSRMIYPSQEEFDRVGSDKYAQIRRTGTGSIETQWLRKDGTVIDVLLSSAAIDPDDLSKGAAFTALDITESKQARQALQFFQFAIEHSGEAAIWTDSNAKFVYVNQTACRMLGYTREALLSMSIPDVDVQFPMDQWRNVWQQLKQEVSLCIESTLKTKDGQTIPVEIFGTFMAYDSREYNCTRILDIRERKKAQEELRLNTERAEALLRLNQMTDLPLSQITDFALEEAVRLTRSKLGYLAFLNEDESVLTMHAWSKTAMAECAMSNKPRHYPVESTGLWGEAVRQRKPIITNDYAAANPYKKGYPEGHVALTRHMNVPIIANSRIVLVAGVGNKDQDYDPADVMQLTLLMEGMWRLVEQHGAEQELANSEKRFREMFQRMSSAVAVYEAVDDGQDFIFTDFNPAAERVEKMPKEKILGRKVTEVFPGVIEFGILNIFRQVWKTGQPLHYPLKLYRDDRVVGWRDNYVYQLPGGEIVALYDDVTERITAEHAREKLMKELQAKNEELESIVFVASHDLRSPLVNIQGFAGELQKSCRELTVLLGRENLSEAGVKHIRRILDEDIPESLNFISAGTSKMDTLAKGLLRLARIGTIQIHIDDIDMNRLMATILKTVQYQMREYEIQINIGDLPPCMGDWVQLNQVFSNLIDNAIKFRHPNRKAVIDIQGGIYRDRARYTVRDNGIGIEPEHTKKIFEVFHRLNPGGPIKGEGLGLTIVQRILDRLDGKIDVEAQPDVGSVFIVELPAVSV